MKEVERSATFLKTTLNDQNEGNEGDTVLRINHWTYPGSRYENLFHRLLHLNPWTPPKTVISLSLYSLDPDYKLFFLFYYSTLFASSDGAFAFGMQQSNRWRCGINSWKFTKATCSGFIVVPTYYGCCTRIHCLRLEPIGRINTGSVSWPSYRSTSIQY